MNKDDLILANAGLDGTNIAQTDPDAVAYLQDPIVAPVIENKLTTLEQAKNKKLNKLAGSTPDILLGMNDADSLITQNYGNTRSMPGPNGWYDAVEIKHGDHSYDMYGSDDPNRPKYQKSATAMNLQRQQVAQILNKPVETVTEQDMIDVGNQQQIQKLADLTRAKDDPRWIAPLIRDVEQTNLTGHYKDENGNAVEAPLNVPVLDKTYKNIHGREGTAFANPNTNENITLKAALDPTQNARYVQEVQSVGKGLPQNDEATAEADAVWNNLFGEGSDNTVAGRVANTIKSGASMFTQGFAGLADMAAEGYQKIGNRISEATGTDLLKSDAEGIWKDGELSKSMDDFFGVDEKYSQQAQQEALDNYKKYEETGDLKYLGKSAWSLLTTPEMYGTSIGFVLGGGVLGVASKANKIRKAAQGFMKLDEKLTKAQAVKKAKDTVESLTKTQKLVENLAHRQPAMIGYSYNDLGNQREEYKKAYGEDMPAAQQAAAFGLDLVANNFDYWADSAAAHGKGVVQNFLKPAFEKAPAEVKNVFVQKAAQAGKKGLTILADMGVEAGTEYSQNVAQGYGTDMGHKTLSESMDDRHDENMVAALGGATGYVQLKGTHNAAEASINAFNKGRQVLDEKIKYHGNNLENPDKTSKPLTLDGKFNMWDSVGQNNFKVEDPKAKDTYAQTIAEFAADLHFNQDARKKYGYMGQKDKGEKNVGDVLKDATDKIATVYDLKDPKSKDIAKYLLTQKLTNVARAKDAATGKYKISKKDREELLKETAEFVKGSKPAEIAFLDMQKQELKDAFTNKVDIKKADEYMTKYGLDQVNNGQIVADLMTLNDEEYKNLQDAVKNMKLLGSSDSVIVNEMGSVSKDLDTLRKAAVTLGSDEGTTGTHGTTKKLHKKTYQEVADEVKHTGFLTRNGTKKSLDKHAEDMNLLVGHDHIPEEVQNGPITALEEFVKHRGINKVKPFNIIDKENTKQLNTDTGISTILKQRINENNDLLNILNNTLNRINPEKNAETVQRLEKMKEDMLENQKQHEEIQKLITSPKEDDKKLAYHKLNEMSTGLNTDVIDELLKTHPDRWHTYNPNYGKTKNAPTAEQIKSLVDKMVTHKSGETTFTPEEYQLYKNNSKEIEQELQRRKKGTAKESANTDQSENESQNAVKEEPPKKVKQTKVINNAPEEFNEYSEIKNGDDTATTQQTKVQEIEELNKRLQIAPAVAKQYKFKDKLLKQLYTKYREDLNNARTNLEALQNKAQMLNTLQKSNRYDTLSAAVQKRLDNAYNKVQKTITKYNNKLDTIKTLKKGTSEDIQFVKKHLDKLQKDVEIMQNGENEHLIKKENKVDVAALKNKMVSTTDYLSGLAKKIDKVTKRIQQLETSKAKLTKDHAANWEEILKLRDKLRKEHKKLKDAMVLLDATKDPSNNTIKLVDAVFKKATHNIKRVVAALKGWITRYTKKHDTLMEQHKDLEAKRKEVIKELNELKLELSKLKEIQKETVTEHARQTRHEVEEVLKDLVKPNNKPHNSISSLIARKASVAEILGIMPRIVTESKAPEKMIETAMQKYEQFVKQRTSADAEKYPLKMFVPQIKDKDTQKLENPLKDIKLAAEVTFEDLWKSDAEDKKRLAGKEYDKAHMEKRDRIRRQVKNAMHVATAVTLKDMIDVRMNNKEQMNDMVDEGFAPIWNSMEDQNDVVIQKSKLKQKIKSGEFVPEAVFRENAGRRMFKELEVLLSDELTIQQKTDIQNAMGVLVLNNLLPKGRMDDGSLVTEAIKRGHPIPNTISRVVIAEDANGNIRAMDPTERQKIMAQGNVKTPGIRGFNLQNLTKEYITDIGDIGTVFEFAEGKDEGQIGLHKMLHKKGDTIANSDVPLADETIKYLNKQGSMAWKFVGLGPELKKYKENNPEGYIHDYIVDMIGTEEDVFKNTPTMKFDSELAKYRAEALTIERMLKAHELVGDDKNFYIKWDYTVSGRSMMRNKLVNPQSSGISRFVVAAKDMINEIDAATISDAEIKHIELAMAQAVDIDIDKLEHEAALEQLHKSFVQIKRKGKKLKLVWAKSSTNKNNILKALVEDKDFHLKKIQELEDKLTESGDITPNDAQLATGSKTIMHLYQVVDLLRKIDSGETKINTNLAIEADGITNGMAIMLMQMGWSDYTQKMLRRAGVYATNDKYKSHGEYKSEYVEDENGDQVENPDIYMSPAKAIQSELGELTGTIEKLIGTKWRNFMKNPVMTFIYGAGINNITKSVAESLVVGNSYISGALADGKINELLEFAGPAAQKIKVSYKKYEKNEDGRWVMKELNKNRLTEDEKAKYAYLRENDIAKLTKAIHKQIAEPFKNGFESTFSEVIEFRQSLKTVEEVNYALFKIRFNEKLNEIGKDKMHNLTPKELLKIKQEMIEEGTYYATDSAIPEQLVDYWKTGKSDVDTGMITVTVNPGAFQSTAGYPKEYNQIIKQLEANVGSIGVTTTHAADGAIMITGHIQDVLNVYDALVMGSDLTKNTEQIQSMNNAFHKINTEHSMLGKAVEKLVNMVDKVGLKAIDPQSAVQLKADIERINPEFKVGEDDEEVFIKDLMKTLEKLDKQREALAKQPLLVNQYMAADDVPGVNTTDTKVSTEGRYKVFGKDVDTEVKAVKEALAWMLNGAVAIHNEEEVKKNADIMTDKLTNIYNAATNDEKAQMMRDIEEVTGEKDKTFAEQLQELKKDC